MATCLLGFGSNLGQREATLRAALDDITALPDVQVVGNSAWHVSRPVGGPPGQEEFLNAAAVIETTVPPLTLLDELGRIETRHGRKRGDRWSPRTLDIDILLYGNEVAETEMLTLPHPRMSFRRFVLEPAAEIAPKMLHPIIGWPVERLLLHVTMASDRAAIVSPVQEVRTQIAEATTKRFGAQLVDPPSFTPAEHHWPAAWTSWLAFPAAAKKNKPIPNATSALPYAAAEFPKLTILIDGQHASPGDKLQWSTLVRQPGRGPMLRLQSTSEIDAEIPAAIEAVWPDLGP
jgi:2-amino-4-hydroxy-6-hydroxymethyldihydropteridine diphosphokinase